MRCETAGPRSRSWLCRANSDFNPPISPRTVALSESLTRRRHWSMNFDRWPVPPYRAWQPAPVNERFCSDSPAEECESGGPDPTRSQDIPVVQILQETEAKRIMHGQGADG